MTPLSRILELLILPVGLVLFGVAMVLEALTVALLCGAGEWREVVAGGMDDLRWELTGDEEDER